MGRAAADATASDADIAEDSVRNLLGLTVAMRRPHIATYERWTVGTPREWRDGYLGLGIEPDAQPTMMIGNARVGETGEADSDP